MRSSACRAAARGSGNQLMMTKTVVNQAYDNMGPNNTQMFATLFDGVSRHSPEGIWRSATARRRSASSRRLPNATAAIRSRARCRSACPPTIEETKHDRTSADRPARHA